MYNKVLAPLDGSKISERSLEHVKRLAASGADVALIYVMEPISYLPYMRAALAEEELNKIEKDSRDKVRKYLDKIVSRFTKEGFCVHGEVLWGSPAEKILEYIKDNSVDLVIMSTHGRSGVQRWAFGSVAEKVIRHSTAPVMIVPPQA